MPTEQTVLKTSTEVTFTDQELLDLRKEYGGQCSDEQFRLWIAECRRRGLWPNRDIVLQVRGVKEWDPEVNAKVFKKKAVYITTIAALLKLSERTGKYAGKLPTKWVYLDDEGNPSLESEVPLPEKGSTALPRLPWAAKVSVLRKDFKEPVTEIARFGAYAQYYNDNGRQTLNNTWATRGVEQLSKCCLALSLRLAFPEELSQLYVAEEIRDEADVQATALEPVQKTDEAPAPATKRRKKSEANGVNVPSLPAEPVVVNKSTDFTFGANAPVPAEGPETAQVPLAPSSPPRFEADDSDVPDNIGTPKDEFPTKDEKTEYAKKLRAYSIDMQQLGDFVKKTSGKSDTREISKAAWSSIFARLDGALDEEDRKQIVLGGK